MSVKKFHGEWEELKRKFCHALFPLTRVINFRLDILSFRRNEKDSLGVAWARFSLLTQSGPDLSLPHHVLFQHFRYGLDKDSAANLDISAGGSFGHKTTAEGRELLDLILENDSFGRSEAIPEVEIIYEDPLHVESEPNSTAESLFQLLEPEEEEIHPSEIPFQFRVGLYEDYGNTLNYSSKTKAHPKHEPFEESDVPMVKLVTINKALPGDSPDYYGKFLLVFLTTTDKSGNPRNTAVALHLRVTPKGYRTQGTCVIYLRLRRSKDNNYRISGTEFRAVTTYRLPLTNLWDTQQTKELPSLSGVLVLEHLV
uniref:Uncharacterized protein n=2 Tax=Oryza sativa subsp. japonica TaxID=39947 RepID=Q6AU22_ORYSJ|nr:hypothetical protein [Oryza sativa Japonica Group]ABF97620.1 hypothetical protein LOC_Os03g41860 [Oryza sativa Japonica Group]